MTEEICVLCNSKLESKTALQDHFRKHANKEIDSKGRPMTKLVRAPLSKIKSLKPTQGSAPKPEVLKSDSIVKNSNSNSIPSVAPSSTISHQNPPSDRSQTSGLSATQQHFTCDVCNMPFTCAAKAITHKWRAHPNEPCKFCCSFCGKQFPLKTILDNHVAEQHTDIEPQKVVKCEECGDEFFNESAKDYHTKVTHIRLESVLRPVATPPPSKKIRLNNAGEADSVYYCHLCGTEYILKFNLRKHLELKHTKDDTTFGGTEIIRCTVCEAIFCNHKAYEVHNMYHQPDDMYVTSEEHRLKTVSRVDQDFDLRRVQIQRPQTVRVLARQTSKLVWNTPINRLASNTRSKALATNSETDKNSSKSPKLSSKGKSEPNILCRNRKRFNKKANSPQEVNSNSSQPINAKKRK